MSHVRDSSPQSWLSNLPSHWLLVSAKTLFSERREANLSNDDHLTPSQKFGVVTQSDYMKLSGASVVQNLQGQNSMKHVEPADFIIHLRSFQGGIERSMIRGKVSTAYTVLSPSPQIETGYFKWLLKSDAYIQELQTTTNQLRDGQSIKYGDFSKIKLPLPPVEEQRVIADFLDRETSRIDTLIAEQELLISLLRERRESEIEHLVSGSFLGEESAHATKSSWWKALPEDWNVVKLGRILNSVSDGPHFSPKYTDDGYMFLSARNIRADRWCLDDAKYVSEEDFREFSKRVVPEKGDILYTKGGTTGVARVVDLNFPFQVWVHIAVLKLKRSIINSHFLAYSLNSACCYAQSQLFTRGATNKDLGLTRMTAIEVPLPPLQIQNEIALQLHVEIAKIDTLIAETEKFIELSRERRAALITAAVTGQIDVREEVA